MMWLWPHLWPGYLQVEMDITVAMEEDDILAMEKEAIATQEGTPIHWIGCNTCLRPASH